MRKEEEGKLCLRLDLAHSMVLTLGLRSSYCIHLTANPRTDVSLMQLWPITDQVTFPPISYVLFIPIKRVPALLVLPISGSRSFRFPSEVDISANCISIAVESGHLFLARGADFMALCSILFIESCCLFDTRRHCKLLRSAYREP